MLYDAATHHLVGNFAPRPLVIGRPESSGASHVSATIRHTCSAVKVGCLPGRGWSHRRYATDRSSRAREAFQCERQARTVSTPPALPVDLAPLPPAAPMGRLLRSLYLSTLSAGRTAPALY